MVSTRFLILSDTHDEWPYSNAEDSVPKVDVLLHCGDLTQVGGLPSFQRAINQLKSMDAELKLVIAGNHDLELDSEWWEENRTEDDDPEDSARAIDLFKQQRASSIHYLEEGTHSFELRNGARFTVYASPYTPEYNGFAFAYSHAQDRFTDEGSGTGSTKRIPSEGVDIVMTHGPPSFHSSAYQLDVNSKGEHCGCAKLARAIARCKPRLHCFGHIHEGRGASHVLWDEGVPQIERIEVLESKEVLQPRSSESTLLVNAAIHGESCKGILVDLDLEARTS